MSVPSGAKIWKVWPPCGSYVVGGLSLNCLALEIAKHRKEECRQEEVHGIIFSQQPQSTDKDYRRAVQQPVDDSSLSTTAACRRQQPVDDSLSTTACRQQLRVLTMVVTVIDGSVMFSYGYG